MTATTAQLQDEKFLTIDEFESALSRIVNPTHRLQFLLMGDAGLRVTEVCLLTWASIDVRRKVVNVHSLKKREGAKVKTRQVPMSDRLYTAMAEFAAKKGRATGYLFASKTGKPVTRIAVNNWLNDLTKLYPDLPHIHPHMLRHTFATNLRANGAELEDIRDALGHQRLDTSLIYAHANPDQLRTLIQAATPRPSFWHRVRSRLFPVRSARMNLPAIIAPDLIGRDVEVKRIETLTRQGTNLIVVGGIGVGKTFLLDSIQYDRPVLDIDDTKDFKKSMANCLIHVLGSKEAVAELIYASTAPDVLQAKVSRESIPNLCRLLINSTGPKEYIIKIGEIDSITPTVVRALELLKDHFTIITSSRGVKMSNSSFLWNFEKVELKPLPRIDSLRLFHRLSDGLPVQQLDWIQNKIYDTSEGNPRMITELAERIRQEPIINAYVVDEICNRYVGRQTREIDASPYLLLFFGGLVILRYVGRENGEQQLTFIGSAIMVLVMFGRYFFRGAKRTTI